jgi:hypothetical protein
MLTRETGFVIWMWYDVIVLSYCPSACFIVICCGFFRRL